MKRTPLALRSLPTYSRGEEQMNMITHAAGGVFSIAGLILLLIIAAARNNVWGISTGSIYGASCSRKVARSASSLASPA